PNRAYIVGEKHPEFFVPRQPGHVSPSLELGGSRHMTINMHIHGVHDADSFRKSQAQVHADLRNEMDRSYYRNR
ncbi:MAG TPA: hypothetical protein VKT80_08380, partial [Chloroflexota bacterium]|nr:hypothetical protein [Chloroflexota bacterium]